MSEHQFWYIESGTGRLDNGTHYWELEEGIVSPCPPDPLSNHTETFYSLEAPPNFEESKVPPALLTKAEAQARSKGTVQGTH
jgi:hypothetical protein